MPDESPRSVLEQISTRWAEITNPMQFVYRYGVAIRAYLAALVRNPHDAEDVTQDFLMRMIQQTRVIPERVKKGRFRDYLKAALRNCATDHFRKRTSAGKRVNEVDLIAAADEPGADEVYAAEWRNVLLDRCWEALEAQEQRAPDFFGYTVLRLTVDRPDDDSAVLASAFAARTGRPMTAEAFRKQRSRARRAFAKTLLDEVRQTLENPSSSAVLDEFTDLGLLEYVREFLPSAPA